MAKREPRRKRQPVPLDAAALGDLALAYVARFATTRAKLAQYLARKIAERGWDDAADGAAVRAALVARLAEQHYIDDRQFAAMRGRALTSRGLGPQRLAAQLFVDGVSADDAAPAMETARESAVAAAVRFAQKRRLGPWASALPADRAAREKLIGAFLRAGHSLDLARRILAIAPGDMGALDDMLALD